MMASIARSCSRSNRWFPRYAGASRRNTGQIESRLVQGALLLRPGGLPAKLIQRTLRHGHQSGRDLRVARSCRSWCAPTTPGSRAIPRPGQEDGWRSCAAAYEHAPVWRFRPAPPLAGRPAAVCLHPVRRPFHTPPRPHRCQQPRRQHRPTGRDAWLYLSPDKRPVRCAPGPRSFRPLPCSTRIRLRRESMSDIFSLATSETRKPAP
jgi:hypothetical protein